MSKAYDFEYKWLDDDRLLGPPHKRFPEMHPERDMPVRNEVFLEIPRVSFAGAGLTILGGAFIYVSMLGFLSVTWAYIKAGYWHSGMMDGVFLLSGTIVVSVAGILLSLLIRPPMPIRLNRITQELITSNGEQVTRIPWKNIPARISKTTNYRGGCFNYCLQFGFGPTPEEVRTWAYMAGHERYEEDALRSWEYFCRYMESSNGHVEIRKIPENEKSASRKRWERDDNSFFTNITFYLFVFPGAWITAKSISLNKRKHKPWPQEVLDICENHPLLQRKKPAR